MSGIYIHIPFCVKKCEYCNFFSVTDVSLKDTFLAALEKEIALRAAYLPQDKIKTLYFGGGTPSLLSPDEIEKIINHIRAFFTLDKEIEITLEANPNNLTKDYLLLLKDTSVNRLSIGIQSFHADDLRLLGRIHMATQAEACISWAQACSFTNLSIDLMYAFPGLTLEKWEYNLSRVKDIPHLSCYQLSLEPTTTLYRAIQTGHYKDLTEEESILQYNYLTAFARKHHFIHYETSNFCKANYTSKHNISYWKAIPYLGLGPGAHSFDGNSRQWNVADVHTYLRFFSQALDPQRYLAEAENTVFEKECLSTEMKYNEYLMTSLRTMWGCDLAYVQSHFGETCLSHLYHHLANIHPKNYTLTKNTLILTETGSLFADCIAASLFI